VEAEWEPPFRASKAPLKQRCWHSLPSVPYLNTQIDGTKSMSDVFRDIMKVGHWWWR